MSRSCQSGWFSKRRLGVAAQQPGEAGDPLGEDRVALVGHRRRALLAGPERLHDLADLRVLEVPDLGREALQRAAGDRDGREERGVAVALDDLRGDRVDVQAQVREHLGLEVRVEVAVRPDRDPRSCRWRCRRRPRQPGPVTVELEGPAGELEARSVVGSAWTECVRPIITVSASARARVTRAATSASASARRRSPAACSCSASAVSTTSLLVSPRWR